MNSIARSDLLNQVHKTTRREKYEKLLVCIANT